LKKWLTLLSDFVWFAGIVFIGDQLIATVQVMLQQKTVAGFLVSQLIVFAVAGLIYFSVKRPKFKTLLSIVLTYVLFYAVISIINYIFLVEELSFKHFQIFGSLFLPNLLFLIPFMIGNLLGYKYGSGIISSLEKSKKSTQVDKNAINKAVNEYKKNKSGNKRT